MSRLIEELYESTREMHAIGVLSDQEMREFDKLYRAAGGQEYTGEKIRELRVRLNMDPSSLAKAIRTDEGTIRDWEADKRKPDGPVCLLFDLLSRKGLEVLS